MPILGAVCGSAVNILLRLGAGPLTLPVDPHMPALRYVGSIPARSCATTDLDRICLERVPYIGAGATHSCSICRLKVSPARRCRASKRQEHSVDGKINIVIVGMRRLRRRAVYDKALRID